MATSLKLKIIACAVFEDELRAVAGHSANELDLAFLDAGLHAAPDRLRLQAQEAIDRAGALRGLRRRGPRLRALRTGHHGLDCA